jgi:CHASE2 domain-containing sensor protein
MTGNNYTELVQFSSRPLWYTVRGVVMIALGSLIAALCITSPDVYILSANFSWIPAIAMVIILLGAFLYTKVVLKKIVLIQCNYFLS